MSAGPRTWEEVLAAVEADAERAATLLAAPREIMPPSHDVAPTILPVLADMPAVPEDLRARIETLRERITELQGELAVALRQWQMRPRAMPVPAAAAPTYLDRRV
jgi:hypothetical protein